MSELLSQFGLNWTLLIAQIINFTVLLWILARFVYRPVLNKLEERRNRIENSLEQAKALEEKTRQGEAERSALLEQAKAEAAMIVSQAKQAAAAMQHDAGEKIVRDAEQALENARRQAALEKEQMMSEMRSMVVESSTAIVERILKDKVDAPTKEKLIHEVIAEIPEAQR